MKIIYLHQYFNTPEMSGGTRSYEMAKRLAEKGHEVHIITSWRECDGKSTWFTTKTNGFNVHWLPVAYSNKMSFLQRIKAFSHFALKAGKKAQEIGGDIVFATSTPLTISIPAIATSKKLKIPMVFEVRDLWPELPIAIGALKNPFLKFLAKQLELFSYKHSKHIIALSPGMAKGIVKTGYPNEKVTMIPNSADLDIFKSDISGDNEFKTSYPELMNCQFVLYAGTLGVINGVGYLVDVAHKAKLLDPSIKFVVFGRGAEFEKIIKKAKKLKVLNNNFFIYPSISKYELSSAFNFASLSSSLFIDLKEMESNSANKFFDGLASGTPVLINYGGWHESLLHTNNAGFKLSRDVDASALSIINILKKPIALNKMGRNARNLAEKEFSRDLLALKLEKILCTVEKEAHK